MVKERVVALGVASRVRGRKARQEHRSERNTQERRRKLHQAVGVVEPGHGPVSQVRGDVRVDENRELRDAHPEERGEHERENLSHVRVGERRANPARAQDAAEFGERRDLGAQLQNAPDEDGGGQGPDGLVKVRGEKDRRADEAEIQKNRRRRRNRKALHRVQNRRRKGDQTHESDVGEHPARERHGKIEGFGVGAHAARDREDEQGRGEDAEHARREDGETKDREDVLQKALRALGSVSLAHVREHRNEGLLKGAFGKETAQHVRQTKGHVEGVRRGGRAEVAGDQHVADHARDAAHEREAGDGERGAE